MTAETNLLFAVLAFENELLDLKHLATACRAWAEDKSQPLADRLIANGWITHEDAAFLHRAVERKLAKYGNDSHLTLSIVTPGDVCRILMEIPDQEVRRSLQSWPSDSPELVETIGQADAKTEFPSSKYSWISEVGAGGLGRVWLARDNELSRMVALKEVMPSRRTDESTRRLIKEAQITGQLQHPGIVPVYDINLDGRPFYTMKLVQGQTLADAIRSYHLMPPGHENSRLEKKRLFDVFLRVCDAVHYAHSRGVIHRDLKPQNIVLGEYGEAVVLDWGLARKVGADDEGIVPVEISEHGLTDATQAGQALGTPAYMSPEQAAGLVGQMDERTDVYGLGAILFELLSGSAPHCNQDTRRKSMRGDPKNEKAPASPVALLLKQIIDGPPPSVKARNPAIPTELSYICMKAISVNPSNRYGCVSDLKTALLQYEMHEQSIELTSDAISHRELAQKSRSYVDFNRALYGFEQALGEWPANFRARELLARTRFDYAMVAAENGDFELALSLSGKRFSGLLPEGATLSPVNGSQSASLSPVTDEMRVAARDLLEADGARSLKGGRKDPLPDFELLREFITRKMTEAEERVAAEHRAEVSELKDKVERSNRMVFRLAYVACVLLTLVLLIAFARFGS